MKGSVFGVGGAGEAEGSTLATVVTEELDEVVVETAYVEDIVGFGEDIAIAEDEEEGVDVDIVSVLRALMSSICIG